MLRYTLLIALISSGFCYNNNADTDILDEYSGSGLENDYIVPEHSIIKKYGKINDSIKFGKTSKGKGLKIGKLSKLTYGNVIYGNVTYGNITYGNVIYGNVTYGNVTYGNVTLGHIKSHIKQNDYSNPLVITLGCVLIVVVGVLVVNKYKKNRGYKLIDRKNYNTFQTI